MVRLNKILNQILLFLAGIAVLSLMGLATVNVVLRIFHMPYGGTYEIVSFLGAVTIALALGYTQRAKNNIIVEILSERFPPTIRRLVDIISSLMMTAFFVIVAWQLFSWGLKITQAGEVSETLRIAFYPYVYCVAVGFAALAFTTFIDLLQLAVVHRPIAKVEAPEEPQSLEAKEACR
ncbi:MAG TPA: TRAP transporter small permease [Deltaproteobacteria bacterium]|nr:TRAP transporter small permease [Deltaproteobacteria bacterium]